MNPVTGGNTPLITRMGNVPALDGVRGIAILMVMTYHFHWQIGSTQDFRLGWLFGAGWSGVDVFFVLSGFLITGILVDALGTSGYFRTFYIRRFLRIFPVYYATLAVIFLVLPLVLRPVPADLVATLPLQPWYWLYAVNIMEAVKPAASFFHTGHLWSLSVEEQFYMLWPLLIWLTPRRWLVHLCLAAAAGGVAFRVAALAFHLRPWMAYGLTPARLDALALGGAVAVLARDPGGSAWLRRNAPRAGIVSTIGLLAGWVYYGRLDTRDHESLILGLVLLAIATCAVIVGLLEDPDRGWLRAFSAPWLRYIGKVSYGVYIFHWMLLIPMRPVRDYLAGLPRPLGLLPVEFAWIGIMITLSLAVASASFYFFERPFLRLKDRLAPTRL